MKPGLAVAALLGVALPALGADPTRAGKEAYDRKDWTACARHYEDAGGRLDGMDAGKSFNPRFGSDKIPSGNF